MPFATDRLRITAWAEELTSAIAADDVLQRVAVLIHDSEATGLRFVTDRCGIRDSLDRPVPIESVVPLDGSICGRVFRTGIPALLPDVSMDPDYLSFGAGRNRSELAVPIVVRGRPVGVVNVEAPWVGAFGIAELDRVRQRIGEAVGSFPVPSVEPG